MCFSQQFKSLYPNNLFMEFKYEYLTLPVLLVLLVGIVSVHGDRDMPQTDISQSSKVNASFIVDSEEIAQLELETATTPEERAAGLMNRTELGENKGMIFIYDESEERSFWMKNTYIPLDMIFLTAERTVRTIKQASPEPNVSDEDLKTYTSEGPAKYVIETNQNFTDEKGIIEGTKVKLEPSS